MVKKILINEICHWFWTLLTQCKNKLRYFNTCLIMSISNLIFEATCDELKSILKTTKEATHCVAKVIQLNGRFSQCSQQSTNLISSNWVIKSNSQLCRNPSLSFIGCSYSGNSFKNWREVIRPRVCYLLASKCWWNPNRD